MGLRLQRCLGPVGCLTPGQYTIETASGEPAVCCPGCSFVSDLDTGVHVGGVVAQIWSCPYAACSFCDYLTLESWGEDVAK